MKWPDLLIGVSVTAFLLSIVLQLIGYIIFRRHVSDYEALISEFRQRNLDLDIQTKVSAFLGPSFHPLKISWFALLYQGVRLDHKRHQRVSRETYEFIQSLPENKIIWLVRLHHLNIVAGVMMTGGGIGFIIWRHFLN